MHHWRRLLIRVLDRRPSNPVLLRVLRKFCWVIGDVDADGVTIDSVTIGNTVNGTAVASDFATIEILDSTNTVRASVTYPFSFPVTLAPTVAWTIADKGTDTLKVIVTIANGVVGHRTIQTWVIITHTENTVQSSLVADDPVASTIDNPPVASNVAITEAAPVVGDTLHGTYTYTDADGDAESGSMYRWLRNGVAIAGATGTTYTLVADDAHVNITFEVTPNDGIDAGLPLESTAVAVANTPPVANDDTGTTPEDTPLTMVNVLTNDTDIDGATLLVSAFDAVSSQEGTVSDNGDGTFDYTPPTDFYGTDTFDYTVRDDNGGTDTGTVTITVTAVVSSITKTFYHGANGWNFLAVPLDPGATDPAPSAVFDELGLVAIYKWNPCSTAAYESPTAVSQAGGYWVYFMGDETITVEGARAEHEVTVTFPCSGWQIIGVPTVPIPMMHNETGNPGAPDIMFSGDGGTAWKNLADARTAGWLDPTTPVWRYDNSTGAYVGVGPYEPLDPWVGYWLKTSVDDVQMKITVDYWLAHPPVPPTGATAYEPLSVIGAETPPSPPAKLKFGPAMDKSGLLVYNEPNPVRDVHTTTFKVKGAVPIEAIRVEIFNQAGQLVFEDEQLGDELVWHTQDDYGENLANGVYLYRVSAKINGKWVVTQIRKLAIVR